MHETRITMVLTLECKVDFFSKCSITYLGQKTPAKEEQLEKAARLVSTSIFILSHD